MTPQKTQRLPRRNPYDWMGSELRALDSKTPNCCNKDGSPSPPSPPKRTPVTQVMILCQTPIIKSLSLHIPRSHCQYWKNQEPKKKQPLQSIEAKPSCTETSCSPVHQNSLKEAELQESAILVVHVDTDSEPMDDCTLPVLVHNLLPQLLGNVRKGG